MESLIVQVRQDLSGSEISTSSLVRVGIALAVRVNKFAGLKGVEKQELVLKAILMVLEEKKTAAVKLASEQGLPTKSIEDQYSLLMTVTKEAVPVAIDAAISAARGSLNLKKIVPPRILKWFVCGLTGVVAAMQQADQLREEMKKASPSAVTAEPSSVELVIRTVEKVSEKVPAPSEEVPAPSVEETKTQTQPDMETK